MFSLVLARLGLRRAFAVALGGVALAACAGAERSDLYGGFAPDGSADSDDALRSDAGEADGRADDGSRDGAVASTEPDAATDARAGWAEGGLDGTVVSAHDAGSTDRGLDGAGATTEPDAAVLDASPIADARADAGAPDSGAAANYTADACLATMYTGSCDPACRFGNCRLFTCWNPPASSFGLNEQTMGALPWRIRTPAATGDLACTTRCGDLTVAKGLVRFEVEFAALTTLTIKVGAPWRVVVNPRYALCVSGAEAATATAGCISRQFAKAMVTVFTTEANAPPRDIVVDRFPRAYCTEGT